MKKIIFSKYFILGLIISFSLGYYFFLGNNTSKNSSNKTSYEKVGTGTIKESISAVGTVELVDEQSLKFNKQGTIVKVNVKEGDKIKKGDIIAELDKKEQNYKIEQARISLENSKIKLKQLYDTVDNSQLLKSYKDIEDTKNSIIIANKELDVLKSEKITSLNDIENNQIVGNRELQDLKISLENQEKDLDITKSTQSGSFSDTETKINSTIVKSEENIKSYIINIEKNLEETDYLFGITKENEDKNDSFEDYLSAENISYKTKAKDLFILNIKDLSNLKAKYSTHTYGNLKELESIYKDLISLNKNLFEMSDNTYNAIENSIENVYFSSNTISSKKSTFSSFKSSSNNDIISLNSTLSDLETLTDTDLLTKTNDYSILKKQESINSLKISITKKENDLITLKDNYTQTKLNYDIKLESKQNSISALNKTLEVNNESLKELQEGPTNENILTAQNNITQSQISLEEANEGLEDYELTAPFSGIVKTLDMKIGDNLTSDSDKSIYIENPDLIEIKIMLDQVDVVKVKLGDKATIKFDSYSDFPVSGQVTYINTTPTSTSGVVSYEVKLIINDKEFKKKILSGMTADVEIVTESKDDVILLKTSNITENNSKNYVTILKNGVETSIEVKTGLSANGKTEIISGLSIGDFVLTQSFSSTSTGTTTKSSSILNGPSGSPPGGF